MPTLSKLAAGASVLGIGALCALGLHLQRRVATRAEDAPPEYDSLFGVPVTVLPEQARQRVFNTFMYVAGGVSICASSAYLCHRACKSNGIRMNTGTFVLSEVAAIASLISMYFVGKDRTLARHLLWATFYASNGIALSPLGVAAGDVIMPAALATGCVAQGLSLLAAVSPSRGFLAVGGALSAGLTILLGVSSAEIFFPHVTALRNINIIGGLALFAGYILYDTMLIMDKAENEEEYDALIMSNGLTLDILNVFVRFVRLFMEQKRKEDEEKEEQRRRERRA